VVKKETRGRQGKIEGLPAHTREVKLGCVFTQTTWDQKGYPFALPFPTTTPRPLNRRRSLAAALVSGKLGHGLEPGAAPGGDGRWGRMDMESGGPALSEALGLVETPLSRSPASVARWRAPSTPTQTVKQKAG